MAPRTEHPTAGTVRRAPRTEGAPSPLRWAPRSEAATGCRAGVSGGHSRAGTVARCVACRGASAVGAAALEGPKTPTSCRGAAASPCPPRPVAPPLAGSLRAWSRSGEQPGGLISAPPR